MRFFTRPPVWGVRGIRKSIGKNDLSANPVASPTLRVALLLLSCSLLVAGCGGGRNAPAKAPVGSRSLQTAAALHPPALRVDVPANGAAPGFVFLAEKGGKSRPSGPVIADDR